MFIAVEENLCNAKLLFRLKFIVFIILLQAVTHIGWSQDISAEEKKYSEKKADLEILLPGIQDSSSLFEIRCFMEAAQEMAAESLYNIAIEFLEQADTIAEKLFIEQKYAGSTKAREKYKVNQQISLGLDYYKYFDSTGIYENMNEYDTLLIQDNYESYSEKPWQGGLSWNINAQNRDRAVNYLGSRFDLKTTYLMEQGEIEMAWRPIKNLELKTEDNLGARWNIEKDTIGTSNYISDKLSFSADYSPLRTVAISIFQENEIMMNQEDRERYASYAQHGFGSDVEFSSIRFFSLNAGYSYYFRKHLKKNYSGDDYNTSQGTLSAEYNAREWLLFQLDYYYNLQKYKAANGPDRINDKTLLPRLSINILSKLDLILEAEFYREKYNDSMHLAYADTSLFDTTSTANQDSVLDARISLSRNKFSPALNLHLPKAGIFQLTYVFENAVFLKNRKEYELLEDNYNLNEIRLEYELAIKNLWLVLGGGVLFCNYFDITEDSCNEDYSEIKSNLSLNWEITKHWNVNFTFEFNIKKIKNRENFEHSDIGNIEITFVF
ncbi:MAG: hypothetical protein ABIA63_07920 [bacterium]